MTCWTRALFGEDVCAESGADDKAAMHVTMHGTMHGRAPK